MVNKCSAFGCKSGYTTSNKADNNTISFHSYRLRNEALLQKWTKNNPRKNFIPTRNSKLCNLHFKDSDFIMSSTDSNKRRNKNAKVLIKRRLRDDAVPTIFKSNDTPSYLSNLKTPERRSTKATTSCRIQFMNDQIKTQEDILELKNSTMHNLSS